jgi:hypothetical protein
MLICKICLDSREPGKRFKVADSELGKEYLKAHVRKCKPGNWKAN